MVKRIADVSKDCGGIHHEARGLMGKRRKKNISHKEKQKEKVSVDACAELLCQPLGGLSRK